MEMETLYNAPAFVINLNRRPDRWETAKTAIETAGFKNIQRVEALDAVNSEATEVAYRALGSPPLHPTFNNDFKDYPGTFGVFLSHVGLWKQMVTDQIPFATVFEDDVLFHTDWNTLAPEYWKETPKDFDVLFIGSQLEFHSKHAIDQGPVFCLHAYCLTLLGAKRLLEFVLSPATGGIYTIDTMLKVRMEQRGPPAFHWYVWNALFFPCPVRDRMSFHWKKRNAGLVYQNEAMGTDIREYE